MSLIESKVRTMRWRLEWLNFCRRFVRLLLAALFVLVVYVAVTKFVRPPWLMINVMSVIVGVTIPLAMLWAILTRTTVREAAVATDRQMALRERLSTALVVGAPRDRMEQALAADAEAHAKPLRAHQVFPMPLWRDLYYMPAPLALIFLVASFVPDFTVIEEEEPKAEVALPTRTQNQLARRLEVFQRELDQVTKTLPPVKMNELSADMEQLLKDLKKQQMSRSDVYKRISKIEDKVADRKGELDKQVEAASQLEKFRAADLTKNLTEAMTKGDFSKAQQELKDLKDKIKEGKLPPDDQKKLSAELKGLSEALQNIPELSKALTQAAQNLEAGDIENALSQLQLTADGLQNLADTLQQMAELDQLEAMLQAMRAAQGLGNSGSTSGTGMMDYEAMLREMGMFRQGDTDRQGSGMGGPGRGMGGIPKFKETETAFKSTKSRMKMDKGDIIGVVKVWGPQVKGEATEKFTEAFLEYKQSAEDTLDRENIPLELRTLVRDYFDAIRPATTAPQPPPDAGAAEK